MTNDNPRHHRRSIRLKGYDYSREGLYFVTICTKGRVHLFGAVENGLMIHNTAGRTADQCWNEIPDHFPNAVLHEFIVMPNHVHGIIEITGGSCDPARANYSPPRQKQSPNGTSKTIGSIVRGYKIGVTKWFHENTDVETVWQRNYYEHVIRNDESYSRISEYIKNNPERWGEDDYYDSQTDRI